MDERWRFNRLKLLIAMVMVKCLLNQNLLFCWSLNPEGLALLRFRDRVGRDPFGALSNWNDNGGEIDHCSWFGVECSNGKVVSLNLKNLCLGGTLAPELGNLIHIKSISLRNNSFQGIIPKEIGELNELEMLDLGYNNFSGTLPSDLGSNLSLAILLFDNNKYLDSISPEFREVQMLSEFQVDENQLNNAAQQSSCNRNIAGTGDVAQRTLLQVSDALRPPKARRNKKRRQTSFISAPSSSPLSSPFPSPAMPPSDSPLSWKSFSPSLLPPSSPSRAPLSSPSNIFLTPIPSPAPAPAPAPAPNLASPVPAEPPINISAPPTPHSGPIPSPSASPTQSLVTRSQSKQNRALTLSGAIGASLFVFISVIGFMFCRSTKVVTVKPWVTGLSGQLQNAFVTGVPKLKRSELETACEDFSNIIGSTSDGTVYKGTLSSGVEIAVKSTTVTSAKGWSKHLEVQFRKKIATLSRLNHKNFINLIGYCEEEEHFTRMMVFEYAPNGTLFEHLHIKEAEHLDWGTRLRIAMGMAYCLEYMHQLTPPVVHKNLNSSAIYLTEDYAAKISDFGFCNELDAGKMGPANIELLETLLAEPEINVYSFGVILFEMITGRIPYSMDNGSLVEYLRGEQYKYLVDPTLKSFEEEELEKLCNVVRSCVHPDPKQRPTMREVTARLCEITALGPDGATPKLSPLWWAEVEILSTEATEAS